MAEIIKPVSSYVYKSIHFRAFAEEKVTFFGFFFFSFSLTLLKYNMPKIHIFPYKATGFMQPIEMTTEFCIAKSVFPNSYIVETSNCYFRSMLHEDWD